MKKPISYDSYEKLAQYYFEFVDTKPYNAYYERPGLLALLPEVAGKRVLDAGCAAGWYTAWLLDRGAEVTALDMSPTMIEMTRRRVGDRAKLVQADMNEPLSFFEDQSFDLVLSSLALHYLKDWEPVLGEFFRILKPGGKLAFSVHHPFMDYLEFNPESYFEIKLLTDSWSTPNGEVEVQFYRRPLRDVLQPLLRAGFILEALEEPMPTEAFHRADPKRYPKLTKRPTFLFVRAGKPT